MGDDVRKMFGLDVAADIMAKLRKGMDEGSLTLIPVPPSEFDEVEADVPPLEVFVDESCSVCGGDGDVDGVRCVLCQDLERNVRSME